MQDDFPPPSAPSDLDALDGLDASGRSVPSSKRPLTSHEQRIFLSELKLALQRCGLSGDLRFLGNDVIAWEHPHGIERTTIPAFAYRATRLPSKELERCCRDFSRHLAARRTGLPSSARRTLPPNAYFALGLASVSLAVLGYFLFENGGSEARSPRTQSTAAAELSCAEISRVFRSGGNVARARLDALELHLVLVARGGTDPLDAADGFSDYFRRQGARFGIATAVLGPRLPKTNRSRAVGRGENLRLLDIDYGAESARSLSNANLDPSNELVEPLADLGVLAAALVTRCPASPFTVESGWFYGSSREALLASSLLFSDGYAEIPWIAEPFLHPPSERETNPAFAFLSLRDGFREPKTQLGFAGSADSIEERSPGFVLRVAPSDGYAFLAKARELIVARRLGAKR